jgi:hypothetical protein
MDGCGCAPLWIASYASPVRAQDPSVAAADVAASAPANAAADAHQDAATDCRRDTSDGSSRLFGVLPNASTIEPQTPYARVTTPQSFVFATEDSFDKAVYPFVGGVFFGFGQPTESSAKRYATSFADDTVSNYMVSAVLPTPFGQDPRNFGAEAATCSAASRMPPRAALSRAHATAGLSSTSRRSAAT